MSEAHSKGTRYIEELERELRNCSLEIGYLQDQLNLRNVDLNYMGEHVHSLELKLGEVGKLHEKLRQSDSTRLCLIQELKDKDEELHNSLLRIGELEMAISSIALESQCEIESINLDLKALEERCFEAAREKAKMETMLEISESKFQGAKERISYLEMENKELKQRLRKELPFSKEICTCEDLHCPFVSSPAFVTALDDCGKDKMKKMSNQIREFQLQAVQLKEELKAEKLKAKEEAEDLVQSMAELRYQMTDMLEEERKRRASIEQTSLRRIQDLEEQVQKEQNKCSTAIRRFQESQKLSENQAVEIRHLRNALEAFRKITDPESARGIESSNCGNCIISDKSFESSTRGTEDFENVDESCNGETSHQALLGWYPDSKAP